VRPLAYIAYFFPPLGGAGVQRTLKFVRYLPVHGWRPTVITVRTGHYWMSDPSLVREVPEETQIVRTAALTGHAILGRMGATRAAGEPNARRSGGTQRRLRGLSRWIAIPDSFVGWVPFAARAARNVLQAGGVLLTTSSPDSAHLVGLQLADMRERAVNRIAWVADFRDPWVRRMSFDPPSGLHRRVHEWMEARVLHSANRIVVTSDATRDDFVRRYPSTDPRRFAVIPNGYDDDDFPAEEIEPDSSFYILHVGQLNPERPVHPFLDCLEAFFAVRPDARGRTRVDFVGPRYMEDEREVGRRGLATIVHFRDALPHREAVALLGRARVLMLLEQESERGALILPGKTFELLRARRPILALVPPGAAWDMISRFGAGECALPSDPGSAAARLAVLYDAYREGGGGRSSVDPALIRQFDRRALAARLAGVLDDAVAETEAAFRPRRHPSQIG
jgi:glycosyltransferase involved in cell wall biosynthesis